MIGLELDETEGVSLLVILLQIFKATSQPIYYLYIFILYSYMYTHMYKYLCIYVYKYICIYI
jgi:hypothetical protein